MPMASGLARLRGVRFCAIRVAWLRSARHCRLTLRREWRERDLVVEAFHGANWYPNDRYEGPRTFDYPKEWEAYRGHYRNDSPWYGSTRIVMRKGRLWAEGAPLIPLGGGVFRVGEENYSPERISFNSLIAGKAMRMNHSGVDFFRTFTP